MKLGFALNNLGPSQLAFRLIGQTNELVTERPDVDVIAFYERLNVPCIRPSFASMPLCELYGHNGTVVATDLSTARFVANCAAPRQRFFLCWDLDWLRIPRKEFRDLRAVYGDERLTLLARSDDHARVLQNAWNRPVTVVGDLDFPTILSLAEQKG